MRKGFEHIPKDAKTNKYLTKGQIFDYIWNVQYDCDVDDVHKSIVTDIICKQYDDVPKVSPNGIRISGFSNFMQSYVLLLGKSIEQFGGITMETIRKFIDDYDFGFSLKD